MSNQDNPTSYTKNVLENKVEIKFPQSFLNINNTHKYFLISKEAIVFGKKPEHKLYFDEVTKFNLEETSLIAMMKNRRVLVSKEYGSILLKEIQAVIDQ